MSRRSLSGVSGISADESIAVDPRDNNYDSSESESEHNELEACVLTHRHVRLYTHYCRNTCLQNDMLTL